MMSLVLTLRCEPEQRLDLSLLVPDRLAGLTESDLSRIELGTTRQPIAVGDIFTIRMGDAADIVIEGGSERLDQIGAAMTSGSLRVTGQAGARAARGMRGGSLVIDGDTGPFAAGMMRGGQVVIGGNAGPFLGAPGPGERAGMSGGVLLVRGHAGEHAASRLRRGTVVIKGDAGEYAAWAMLGGTLVICGRAEAGCAGLMQRGTVLIGGEAHSGAGFVEAEIGGPVFLHLLAQHLRGISGVAAGLCRSRLTRMTGDLSAGGQGEVFLATT